MRIGLGKLLRMGLVSTRVRGGQAVGVAEVEEEDGSSGMQEKVSLALTFHGGEQFGGSSFPPWQRSFARRVCVDGKMEERERETEREQKTAWRKLVFEVQRWRQVTGPGGAVMHETRALGIRWPQWHALMYEEQVTVDMRVVCPQNVSQVPLKQARLVGLLEDTGNNARP